MPTEKADPMVCPRCETTLEYSGTKQFHEGSRTSAFFLGDWSDVFGNREHFDVYVCPRCGRVEFFLDGTGDEFRPH